MQSMLSILYYRHFEFTGMIWIQAVLILCQWYFSDYGGCVHTDATSFYCLMGRMVWLQRGPYPKGVLPVKVTSQTRVSGVLASSI